jgi:hypothetical protein
LYGRFNGLGTLPWDHKRASIVAFSIDPSVVVNATQFNCTGTDPTGGANTPCTGFNGSPQARFADTLTVVSPNSGVSGWYPWIEIDYQAKADPTARVCLYTYSDFSGTACPDRTEVACADGGSVLLDRVPTSQADTAGLKLAIDATFGSFHLQGTIALP